MSRTTYDLTDPDGAQHYLEEESPRRAYRAGKRCLQAARVEAITNMAAPHYDQLLTHRPSTTD